MNGKKRLSDFFIDNKFTQFDKEECYLLCSERYYVDNWTCNR